MTTQQKQPRRQPVAKAAPKCDNHPGREATFSSTSNGAHQRVYFCDACIPRHWRR